MNRPNILVFLTDDHGQWASSAYGNRELHTPVMQWLSDTGTRFDHAFSPNPVCSPARACFWTGQIPSRHGIHDYLMEPNEDPEHHGIAGAPTLGSMLKREGYRTGLVGKWHAGDYWQPMPGFDTWFTSLNGTNAIFGEQDYIDGTKRLSFFGHQEIILTDRALEFLREERSEKEPFFLFVGYTNTHTPHSGEAAPLAHHYRKASFRDIPRETYEGEHGHARIAPFDPDEPRRRESLAHYYAAVEAIDQQMLRLIAELESRGELENTLLVYTGDHGHMNGHHGLHTKANATIPANFVEETIHIPMLVRPAGGGSGRPVASPVDHCDLWATILDVAGAPVEKLRKNQVSPGHSLIPLMETPATSWRDIQFCEAGPSRMVRRGKLKLIRRFPYPSGLAVHDELYDLEKDPRECCNLIDQPEYEEAIRELSEAMEAFYAEYEDPAVSGTGAGLKVKHNVNDPWLRLPGEDDHRQN
jgi:arylsulfatase A-like enzyme